MQFVALALVVYPLYTCALKRWNKRATPAEPVRKAIAKQQQQQQKKKKKQQQKDTKTQADHSSDDDEQRRQDGLGVWAFARNAVTRSWTATCCVVSLASRVFRYALYCVCSGALAILTCVVVVTLLRGGAPNRVDDDELLLARIAADSEL